MLNESSVAKSAGYHQLLMLLYRLMFPGDLSETKPAFFFKINQHKRVVFDCFLHIVYFTINVCFNRCVFFFWLFFKLYCPFA